MSPATRAARLLALASYFGLLVLLTAWTAWLAPPARVPVALVLLVLVAPLLLPLRGLLYARPYTHAWASFLALLYFAHGVSEAYANTPVRAYALGEILLSVLFFLGCVLYARLRSRELRRLAARD